MAPTFGGDLSVWPPPAVVDNGELERVELTVSNETVEEPDAFGWSLFCWPPPAGIVITLFVLVAIDGSEPELVELSGSETVEGSATSLSG